MNGITRASLSNFTGNLRYRLDLLSQTRKHTDRLLATRFNVFNYIVPNENLLSDLIHDLLDVNGDHGQGDVFLREFVEAMCGAPPGTWTFRSVVRENTTSLIESYQRRIDILLDLDTFGIAVENKPWAGEQKDQINDYVAHLERRFAGNFVIVYLSAAGSKPTSIDSAQAKQLIKEEKLVLAAYRGHFRDWLKRCFRVCAAEKIRWFLTDFIDFAEQKFTVLPEAEIK